MNKTTGEQNNSENYVVLASRLPLEVKEKVERFANKTMRTVSSSVHYLLETHPELQPKNQPEQIALDK